MARNKRHTVVDLVDALAGIQDVLADLEGTFDGFVSDVRDALEDLGGMVNTAQDAVELLDED